MKNDKSKKLELSIIIPTLNEEEALPLLLKSLKANLKGLRAEVLVIDAHSQDRTVEKAKKSRIRNLRIFQPKKRGQSYQRNYGASKARAPLLLFLDADIILPRGFLRKALKEINERKLDVAATYCKAEKSGLWERFCYNFVANSWMHIFERVKPFGHCCFFIKRELHDKIGGVNERMFFGEDSEYLERAKKAGGKFRILSEDKKFIISTRGFRRYGRLSQSAAFVYLNLYRLTGHERIRKGESTSGIYEKFRKVSPSYIESKVKRGMKRILEYEKKASPLKSKRYILYHPLIKRKKSGKRKKEKRRRK